MTLQYGFDVIEEEYGDVALFRDPMTVDALRGADSRLQDFFLASGFRLSVLAEEVSHHTRPRDAAAARIAVIERLAANMTAHDLSEIKTNGFDFLAFLDHLEASAPRRRGVMAQLLSAPFESLRIGSIAGVTALVVATVVVWQGSAMLAGGDLGEGHASVLHSLARGGE